MSPKSTNLIQKEEKKRINKLVRAAYSKKKKKKKMLRNYDAHHKPLSKEWTNKSSKTKKETTQPF